MITYIDDLVAQSLMERLEDWSLMTEHFAGKIGQAVYVNAYLIQDGDNTYIDCDLYDTSDNEAFECVHSISENIITPTEQPFTRHARAVVTPKVFRDWLFKCLKHQTELY